ncbi:hypothetical protein OBBRIDRAFT_840188 [Obba rivulosa]|uniref:Uncharacterized protein n=1 Tax=Obba rivulosa TaxID=1052685 RepID=A0A8E2ANE9_9APHY|nr:hypothetical protein OBBRIDRAFT_840188 [Obba rivulosa]
MAMSDVRTLSSSYVKANVDWANTPTAYSAVTSMACLPQLGVTDITGCNIASSVPTTHGGAPSGSYTTGPPSRVVCASQGHSVLVANIELTAHTYRVSFTSLYDCSSNVLVAVYCWTHDAGHLGALAIGNGTVRAELIDHVLRGLSTVHGVDMGTYCKSQLQGQHVLCMELVGRPLCHGNAQALRCITTGLQAGTRQKTPVCFGPQLYDEMYEEIFSPAAYCKLLFADEVAIPAICKSFSYLRCAVIY